MCKLAFTCIFFLFEQVIFPTQAVYNTSTIIHWKQIKGRSKSDNSCWRSKTLLTLIQLL